jgi:adenosylcobyric acid synthase
VFAHLVGTIELIPLRDRSRIQAFAINKFRGDPALLEPGLRILQNRTGLPVAGVIPYMHDVGIADEDSVALDERRDGVKRLIDVAVMHLPHISNFDDFDALDRDPVVGLRYVDATAKLGRPDLIVLPGTKATVDDLAWLRTRGLADALTEAVRGGTALLGVCGGYQMLGQRIVDPHGVESRERSVRGLGLLQASTEFEPAKATTRVEARVLNSRGLLAGAEGSAISGYEIHMGRTYTTEAAPFSVQRRREQGAQTHDGAITGDGWILGTYLHGLLANDALRSVILRNLAARKGIALHARRLTQDREGAYDRLAAQVRESLDMRLIGDMLQRSGSRATAAPARNGWAS